MDMTNLSYIVPMQGDQAWAAMALTWLSQSITASAEIELTSNEESRINQYPV